MWSPHQISIVKYLKILRLWETENDPEIRTEHFTVNAMFLKLLNFAVMIAELNFNSF